ncbi:DMT family transporter [Ruegeria sp. 1NDH52C]|uniref:DMT family transporter n=1 Tax=Ruegeria alba TaxID=2916756 RepID=A0ABS9NVF6_9RHOB|nr:DMT family transporter [Ruegeria alba]MCG6558154.1 DMT family transporter [Ruegeria alba]
MTQSPDITAKSWAMVATLGFVWGGTFLINELALEGITPFWLAAGRVCFGAVLSTLVWRLMGGRLFSAPLSRSERLSLVTIALLSSAVPFSLIAWGQQYVTAGFTGVSMASIALMVLPLAHFLVPGERMTWRRALGFAIGFAGVALLMGAQAFESSGATLELPGRLACLAATACYAVASILMRRLPAVDPVGLSTVLLLIGVVAVLPMAWIAEGPPPSTDLRTLGLIVFLGMVPTAAANLLRVTLIRSAGPVFMSLTNYQVPVWSVLLGAALLGEPLPPVLLWSLLLILTGVGLSQYGALRRLFARQ